MTVELTWYGHACWGVETPSARLIIDPFFSDNPKAPIKVDEVQGDYILISHGHFDHLADAALIGRRSGAKIISNFEIVSWFQEQHGLEGHPLHVGGGHDFPFGRVQLTIAHHGSTLPDGKPGGNPVGFLLRLEGKVIYDAADTGLFYDMRLIGERHPLDVALLPIGDNFTMGPDDALYAVKLLEPKVVIPMHYDTWELIAQDARAWARRVEEETQSQCVVLEPGHSHRLT